MATGQDVPPPSTRRKHKILPKLIKIFIALSAQTNTFEWSNRNMRDLLDFLFGLFSTDRLFSRCCLLFQYEKVPDDYDEVFTNLTRQGARVLAMGIKDLPQTRIGEVSRQWRLCRTEGLFGTFSCVIRSEKCWRLACDLQGSL